MSDNNNLVDELMLDQRQLEQMFAACAYIAPDAVAKDCGWLEPGNFTDKRIKTFWREILDGRESSQASIDSGLMTDLSLWSVRVPSFLNAKVYAEEISKIQYMQTIANNQVQLAKAIGDRNVGMVREIIEGMSGEQPLAVDLPPTIEDLQEKFERVVMSHNRSVMSQIPELDEIIGGFEKQTLSVIAGRPSMGKSAISLDIAKRASKQGSTILFFELEMADVNLWGRIALAYFNRTRERESWIQWKDVRSDMVSDGIKREIIVASKQVASEYPTFYIDDESRNSLEDIWRKTAAVRPDLVIVDHLGLVKGLRDENRARELGVLTDRLKGMAKVLDTHVMLIHQLNRGVEGRSNKRPTMSDLRDSGEIEQNADLILMLYRDDYYDDATPTTKMRYSQTELKVAKFRDGVRNNVILLDYDLRDQSFKKSAFAPLEKPAEKGYNLKGQQYEDIPF